MLPVSKKQKNNTKATWLNLYAFGIIDKNVRKLIYKRLTKYDMEFVLKSHIRDYTLQKSNASLSVYCAGAAKYGHLHVLKWLRLNKVPWDSDVCAFASQGHLDV
jgi:hypothetical protein